MRAIVAYSLPLASSVSGRFDFRIVHHPRPDFHSQSVDYVSKVLVRTIGFCINYRDRAIMHQTTKEGTVIGSEFVGVVEEVGVDVESLRPGDRVIADMQWPVAHKPGMLPGVPTNAASAEYLVLEEASLIVVPKSMPIAEAAAFSLSAQTGFAMVRRADIRKGERVLVTAGSSSTSLALVQALKIVGAEITVLTGTAAATGILRALGANDVIYEPSSHDRRKRLAGAARRSGGFAAIFDPFADVYLPELLPAAAFYGRYVTCGVADQGWFLNSIQQPSSVELAPILSVLIAKNLRLIGNCLGLRDDLAAALSAFAVDRYRPIVAATYSEHDLVEFADHYFGRTRKIGKPVFIYGEKN